jgi:hypothetical protein
LFSQSRQSIVRFVLMSSIRTINDLPQPPQFTVGSAVAFPWRWQAEHNGAAPTNRARYRDESLIMDGHP